jgi:hypothetical protein
MKLLHDFRVINQSILLAAAVETNIKIYWIEASGTQGRFEVMQIQFHNLEMTSRLFRTKNYETGVRFTSFL